MYSTEDAEFHAGVGADGSYTHGAPERAEEVAMSFTSLRTALLVSPTKVALLYSTVTLLYPYTG